MARWREQCAHGRYIPRDEVKDEQVWRRKRTWPDLKVRVIICGCLYPPIFKLFSLDDSPSSQWMKVPDTHFSKDFVVRDGHISQSWPVIYMERDLPEGRLGYSFFQDADTKETPVKRAALSICSFNLCEDVALIVIWWQWMKTSPVLWGWKPWVTLQGCWITQVQLSLDFLFWKQIQTLWSTSLLIRYSVIYSLSLHAYMCMCVFVCVHWHIHILWYTS